MFPEPILIKALHLVANPHVGHACLQQIDPCALRSIKGISLLGTMHFVAVDRFYSR
jgi:hypothetical protein